VLRRHLEVENALSSKWDDIDVHVIQGLTNPLLGVAENTAGSLGRQTQSDSGLGLQALFMFCSLSSNQITLSERYDSTRSPQLMAHPPGLTSHCRRNRPEPSVPYLNNVARKAPDEGAQSWNCL
jgi:hypothetical protein